MKPARLHKADNCHRGIEAYLQRYAPFFLIICIIVLVILIIALAMAVTGVHAYQLTGTEANLQYNHLEQII